MRISRLGIHFKNRNVFWKDLFSWPIKIEFTMSWKRRGQKLFLRQCVDAWKDYHSSTPR